MDQDYGAVGMTVCERTDAPASEGEENGLSLLGVYWEASRSFEEYEDREEPVEDAWTSQGGATVLIADLPAS